MKKGSLIGLAILAIAGGAFYFSVVAFPIQRGPGNPLGDAEEIDGYLVSSLGMRKEEVRAGKGMQRNRYYHEMTHEDLVLRESITVTSGSDGRVRALESSFEYMAAMDDPTFFMTKVPALMIGFWRELGGPKRPLFKPETRGAGWGKQQVYVALLEGGGAKGEWIHNRKRCAMVLELK